MKKAGIMLISFTAAFLVLISGVLIGRQWNGPGVILTPTQDRPSAETSLTEPNNTTERAIINGKININTASAELLMEIPNIGPTLSGNIIAYREEFGPFSSVEELINVKGIGETRLQQMLEYVTVGD